MHISQAGRGASGWAVSSATSSHPVTQPNLSSLGSHEAIVSSLPVARGPRGEECGAQKGPR